MLPYHILVIGSVYITATILEKWLEATCFLIAYFALRYKFNTTFHAERVLHCMIFTNVMFVLSVILCPYVSIYIFGSMLFAWADCALLYILQRAEELKQDKECAERAVAIITKQLKGLESPDVAFYDKCKKAKLSKRDTAVAYKYYIEHNTPKEIWLWLCDSREFEAIEWDSLYQLLWRIGKKLNNVEDL